jgi:CDP-paratose 2-epimerase
MSRSLAGKRALGEHGMKVLVTGGAGFIGSHTAARLATDHQVVVADNLSRKGSESNLAWLRENRPVEFAKLDVRDAAGVRELVGRVQPELVIHLAAQVAVTTSVTDPRTDFEVNAMGTFNVLEAVRTFVPKATVLFSSTNKVYGGMEDEGVEPHGSRYRYRNLPHGAAETQPLDFHSPYGCSKGAADQYVRDYARIYGLKTLLFRMSCIYGTRQFGVEDQGWVAWFSICAAMGRPVTIYGDGKQTRDVLWVDDLVDAYLAGVARGDQVKGQAFNMGGGADNQLSLVELMEELARLSGRPLEHRFADWRPGDQRVFVADTRKAQKLLDWRPKVSPSEGVRRLYEWVQANRGLFAT